MLFRSEHKAHQLEINENNIRFPMLLFETGPNTVPNKYQWGTMEGLQNHFNDGVIPQNVRVSLLLMDMSKPYIRDIEIAYYSSSYIKVQWRVGGAVLVNDTYVEWDPWHDNGEAKSETYEWFPEGKIIERNMYTHRSEKQEGPGFFANPFHLYEAYIPIKDYTNVNCAIRISAITDADWKTQENPSPQTPPLTHFVRTRINPTYTVKSGSTVINTSMVFSTPSFGIKEVIKPSLLAKIWNVGLHLFLLIAALFGCYKYYGWLLKEDPEDNRIPVPQTDTNE